jgi:peptidoglycan/LPS O-acetylase OafA/YrhL
MSDRPEFNYVYYIGHAAKVGGRILDHGCGLFARSDDRTLATLDVLRGIAILLVLVAHFLPFDGPIANAMLLSCANAGVILFFFLSGFLMDRTFAQDSQILPYVVRRAFRILPMYWISIILIFLLEREWSVRDAIANATFTTQVMHVSRMSGVYWTLYVEVAFYALVPILWRLGPVISYWSPFALAAVFTGAWLAGLSANSAFFYLVYCLIGMQFGLWHRGKLSGAALAVSMIAVVIGSSVLPIVSPFLGLAPLVCGLLLYAALRYPIRFGLFEIFGDVSYSWYLLHPIVGYRAMDIALSIGCQRWLAAIFGVSTAFVLSAASFLIIERPMIKLGKGLIRMRRTGLWASVKLYLPG